MVAERFCYIAVHGGVIERAETDRTALPQRFEPGERERLAPPDKRMRARQFGQCGLLRHVRRALAKGADMDRPPPGQSLEQVVRADLVAAIGRKGHAVPEEQCLAHQPSPREIQGPSRLATCSGSRFHKAIIAE